MKVSQLEWAINEVTQYELTWVNFYEWTHMERGMSDSGAGARGQSANFSMGGIIALMSQGYGDSRWATLNPVPHMSELDRGLVGSLGVMGVTGE